MKPIPNDLLLKILNDAPLDDEPLTDEERLALREADEDIKAGRVEDWDVAKKRRTSTTY